MNIKYWASIVLASFIFISCDDTTDNIGSSLIDNADKLNITTDTFTVATRSIVADSVLSRNTTGSLGKVRDPETGTYLTSNFTTQFYSPENFSFPEKDSIKSLDANGEITADSCDISLYYTTYYGDSLAPMKLSAYELSKPIEETDHMYTNFNPENGYVDLKKSAKVSKVYTMVDLNVDESTRSSSEYLPSIRIPLKKEFGASIMKAYYKNPEIFKNSYNFIHQLVPGFYFKTAGGIGSMAYISLSQLNVYFRYKTQTTLSDGTRKDTIFTTVAAFPGTEEVLQTTDIIYDKDAIRNLANDKSCTYIKSPAGIFTEMQLPVNEIVEKQYIGTDGNVYSHRNDTINTAEVVLQRINDTHDSKYNLGIPQTLLMVPKAEMYSFFEKNKIADYKTSFLATYDKSKNNYTFHNIGSLIKYLYDHADKTKEGWNSVVLIPVTTTYNTSNNTVKLISVSNDMTLTSTRLVGGEENQNGDIKISVIYSKFK